MTRNGNDTALVRRLADLGSGDSAEVHHPNPVIVRTSDFKTNEYAELMGGGASEPAEENPMLGWRGASRYYAEGHREGFALECRAIRRAREHIGLDNIVVMIPFCRTLTEAMAMLLDKARRKGTKTGICGQAPSDHPEFADFLVRHGIGSISVSPDSFLRVKEQVAPGATLPHLHYREHAYGTGRQGPRTRHS